MRRVEAADIPIRFFATPETHNTPRATMRFDDASEAFHVWQMLRLLPGAVGFLHAGMELGEGTPVNTGLEFTEAEQQTWTANKLPLFSDVPLHWDEGGSRARSLRAMEREYHTLDIVRSFTPEDTITVLTDDVSYVGFLRYVSAGRRALLVLHDLTGNVTEHTIKLPDDVRFVPTGHGIMQVGHQLTVSLAARSTRVVAVAV